MSTHEQRECKIGFDHEDIFDSFVNMHGKLFIDHVAGAIIRLVASMCVCVCLSVGALLFELFDL